MSEQWIKAFRGDAKKLDAFVGSKDRKLVKKMLSSDLAEDVAGLLEEVDLDLERVLVEIADGKLKKTPYAYRRVLELVAEAVMKPLEDEATMPGRGWQDLGPAWKHWGAPTLAKVWGGSPGWPGKKNDTEWPLAYVIVPKDAAAIAKELKSFEMKDVPSGIDRFSQDWPLEDLKSEIENIAGVVSGWCKSKKGDILVWHDGQQ